MGNLSGEAKAPTDVFTLQLRRSASNSVAVGKRYPLGHGLFTPFTPCHKLLFWGLRQSKGEFGAMIKFPLAVWSTELRVAVVTDVRH